MIPLPNFFPSSRHGLWINVGWLIAILKLFVPGSFVLLTLYFEFTSLTLWCLSMFSFVEFILNSVISFAGIWNNLCCHIFLSYHSLEVQVFIIPLSNINFRKLRICTGVQFFPNEYKLNNYVSKLETSFWKFEHFFSILTSVTDSFSFVSGLNIIPKMKQHRTIPAAINKAPRHPKRLTKNVSKGPNIRVPIPEPQTAIPVANDRSFSK